VKNVKKLVLFALYIIVLGIFVSAETISETAFSELGYSEFAADHTLCRTHDFLAKPPQQGEYFVISLHSAFIPLEDSEAKVTVSLNGSSLGAFLAADFTDGWLRIDAGNQVADGGNALKVCLRPSESSVRIVLHNDSGFGTYLMPDFRKEWAFTKDLSDNSPYTGEEFTVTITLRNYGSEDANAEIRHASGDIEETFPYLRVVRGELEKSLVVGKCRKYSKGECVEPETASMSYTVKSEKAINLLLLPAVAVYTNAFGEETELKSNRAFLDIRIPEAEIKASLLAPENDAEAGAEKEITLRLENTGPYAVYNLTVGLEAENLSTAAGTLLVDAVEPHSAVERTITVEAQSAGEAILGCSVSAEDYNNEIAACAPFLLIVKGPENSYWLAGGAILALLSLLVYLRIAGRK
jgi:hypothetical protein